MLLICFVSSIAALITKADSNTIGEIPCDLSLRCMNDSSSVPARSAAIRCIKRTSHPILDVNSSCTVNQVDKIHIHLKDIRIKQRNNSYWVQVILSSYDDHIKKSNQFLRVKFLFEKDHASYQFSIPSFIFMSSKNILLPCFEVPMLQRHYLRFYFSVHHETDEVISIQALNYSLNNVANGQWLGGSIYITDYDFNDELIYFSLNATQGLKCPFNNSITIYKSHLNDVCNIEETPVYKSVLLPNHKLIIRQNVLSPCQKYCIYALFSKSQQCGTLHLKHFIDIVFFKLPPLKNKDCENWNFTIDVKTIQKDIFATVFLWPEYVPCFSSYFMHLYQFDSPTCDQDLGYSTLETFKFEAGLNNTKIKKVFKNVTVGCYCILVVPFLNGSTDNKWIRDSGSFNVSENAGGNNTELNEKDEKPEFGTKVIAAISFLLFFTAFALWLCSEHIRRFKTKADKSFPEKNNKKEEIESIPLLTLDVDTVYLFYPGDDDSLSDNVLKLKDFLRDEARLNVITLSDVLPEILQQPKRYISAILECGCPGKGSSCTSKKKFIVVFSEKVLLDFYDNNFKWKFNEEKVFREVLEYITTDWGKAYCHLFVVAFNESIFFDHRFKSIVSKTTEGVYYAIPNDLSKLCVKLSSSSSIRLQTENLRMRLEHKGIWNAGSR